MTDADLAALVPPDARRASNRKDVLAAMQRAGITMTAENYAVWREYQLGDDARLRRALDIMLSNGRVPDDSALHKLYLRYCAPVHETSAFRQAAQRALATLRDAAIQLEVMRGASAQFESLLPVMQAGLCSLPGTVPGSIPGSDAGLALGHALASGLGLVGPELGPALGAKLGIGPGHAEQVLRPLIERLSEDTHDVIRHSAALARRLDQSAERIDELEQFLNEARQEAATDPLTGLANRRGFDRAVLKAAADAMNSDKPLCLLMADVDHFKKVNDTWGHDTGDATLRMVADAITQSVRGRDLAARHGGEEFAVILPETSGAGAVRVAENIRQAVMGAGLVLPNAGSPLAVTISLGVSVYDLGEKISSFTARADTALYQAKQAGRNRTMLARTAVS